MNRSRCMLAAAAVLLVASGAGIATAQTLTSVRVASGLSAPLFVTSPRLDLERLFIVEQNSARIKILRGGTVLPVPFLDIGPLASSGGERGLLGLAFHPDYASNGFFYVDYTDNAGNTVVARYHVSGNPDVADPASAKVLLTVTQPFSNHNGGMIAFGPDGFLYIGMGDGGSGNDPGNRAQNPATFLGKILRIDVDGGDPYAIPPDNPFVGDPGALDEIWTLGMRNPWRFSFDRKTGDLYIADVGQDLWEEVDIQPASSPGGENYGWRCMEGKHCTGLSGCTCNAPELTLPVYDYFHSAGNCSITGGYVYRGMQLPEFDGTYFFGDFCTGRIWTFEWDGTTDPPTVTDRTLELDPPGSQSIGLIASFGEDAAGNLYIVDWGDGEIFQVVRRQPDVEITMTPAATTVGPGEFLFYDVSVTNHTGTPRTITAWIDVIQPNLDPWPGNPLIGPKGKTIAASAVITKSTKLKIPASTPPSGPYFLRGAIGTFPDGYDSVSSFAFLVE